jgi:hypothetical protein
MSGPRALALGLALLLGGCAETGVLGVPYYRGTYIVTEPSAQGMIPVVVRGNPFPFQEADVAREVVEGMQGWSAYPVRLAPATVNPQGAYRVVVLFSPPINMPYPDMCSAGVLPSPPQETGRAEVSAVLCKWDVLMAAASGRVDAAAPADPRFRSTMAAFARALFPVYNPDDAMRNGNRIGFRF